MEQKSKAIILHERLKGKLETTSKIKIKSKTDLSLLYTPGVAEVSKEIHKDKNKIYDYTIKDNTIAIISDGSAVLGLGNIGPEAALPVMEGKAILFKELANINAFPIILTEQNTKKTIETIKNISTSFGGINLEDFKAPECFEIEKELQDIGIPVMHDDQHATAIVVLAGLINAIRLKGAEKEELKVVINGTGAAGVAITKILINYGFKKIILVDTKGIIYNGRDYLNEIKKELAKITNTTCLNCPECVDCIKGNLTNALKKADIFIGVSKENLLTKEMIQIMNKDPIIFALSNPNPEIMPELAKEAGAYIIATGRSDYPNQINNVLAFPGIFKGALEIKAKRITNKMKIRAAEKIASLVKNPNPNNIIPSPLEKDLAKEVAEAVKQAYLE
jgi:malate dehydrogenase (oxaloacetate-decarboxylating)